MTRPAPIPVDSLAARASAGDVEAVQALVARWAGAIRRWTLASLGDVHRADDAAQDAVERLLKGLPSYDSHRPFEPWLRQIVRNASTDQHRKRSRRREDPEVEVAHGPDPGRALDLARGARRALEAFAELTERQRAVLMAIDHDGRSVDEVAQALDIGPSTVRSVVCKARRSVRLRLLSQDPELAALLEGP
jgi:RNA polymerase sigma-70 factor (ECF subfamily)